MTVSAEKSLRSTKHYCVLQVRTTPFSELSPYLEMKLKLAAAISLFPGPCSKLLCKLFSLSMWSSVEVTLYSRGSNRFRVRISGFQLQFLYLLVVRTYAAISALWAIISPCHWIFLPYVLVVDTPSFLCTVTLSVVTTFLLSQIPYLSPPSKTTKYPSWCP